MLNPIHTACFRTTKVANIWLKYTLYLHVGLYSHIYKESCVFTSRRSKFSFTISPTCCLKLCSSFYNWDAYILRFSRQLQHSNPPQLSKLSTLQARTPISMGHHVSAPTNSLTNIVASLPSWAGCTQWQKSLKH